MVILSKACKPDNIESHNSLTLRLRRSMTQLILAIYLPLIRKDSSTHMHGLEVYVKEGFPFARDLSLENSADFYLLSTGFTSPSVLLIFALSITFFSFVHGF